MITEIEEQINEYQEVFAFFDRHNTGRIDLNELGLITRSIGFNPSEMKIKQIQEEYEHNGIDKINFQQFLQILISLTNEIEDEIDIIEAFRVFDKEGQGMIVFLMITILIVVLP
jgi:calmodulin